MLPKFKRTKAKSRHFSAIDRPRRRGFRAESLEQRLVLSGVTINGDTLFFTTQPGETNDVLISESAGVLTVRDLGATITPGTGPITVVSPNEVTVPVAGISKLNISLGDMNDSFDGSGVGVSSGIVFAVIGGDDGNDTLIGTQITDAFSVFGFHTGADSIDGQGQLSGQRDVVRINSDVDVTGTDTTYQVGSFIGTHQNLEHFAVDGGVSDNVIDVSGITPSSGFVTVQLNGGDGNDTIIGSQLADSLTILGTNPGGDTIDLQGAPVGQSDSMRIRTDLDVTVTDTTLTVGGANGTHVNVERLAIDGGPSANIIDLSGITPTGDIVSTQTNADDGDDTIIGSQIGDTIVISGNNPGADTIDAQSEGAGQRDVIFVNTDLDITMTDTLLQVGTGAGSHAGFENLSVNGGVSANNIDLSGISASASFEFIQINGGEGNDTITGSQLADRFIYSGTNPGSDTIDGQGDANGSDQLFVSADADLELGDTTFTAGGVVSQHSSMEVVSLSGGVGDNIIDARSLTTASGLDQVFLVGQDGNDTIIPGDFGVYQFVAGRAGFDTLDLRHATVSPNVNITGPGLIDGANGSYGGISAFSDIDDIILPPEYDFTATSYSTAEGNTTNTVNVVEVTRSINTSIASSVDVVLSSGTATVGNDVSAGPITVNFAAGEVTKTVPIEILGDTDVEGDETIQLSFADGIAGTTTSSSTLTILNDDVANQPPELLNAATDATLADKAVPGSTVNLVASFTDPDVADTHTAVIDWGDGTTSPAVVDQNTGTISGNHAYSTGGIFDVSVVITDSFGETDSIGTSSVVSGVRVDDHGVLQIIGTDGRDHIKVKQKHGEFKFDAKLDQGSNQFRIRDSVPANSVLEILIITCEGNDHINVKHSVNVAATILAGAGNDHVSGGSGNDVIIGGSGRDHIHGNGGSDIIIGGAGRDVLSGGWGQDLIIAGYTNHDEDLNALDQIHSAWNSNDSFANRVSNLSSGLLSTGNVHDDDVRDRLYGGGGSDWFFADIHGCDRDSICDYSPHDELTIVA